MSANSWEVSECDGGWICHGVSHAVVRRLLLMQIGERYHLAEHSHVCMHACMHVVKFFSLIEVIKLMGHGLRG